MPSLINASRSRRTRHHAPLKGASVGGFLEGGGGGAKNGDKNSITHIHDLPHELAEKVIFPKRILLLFAIWYFS